MVSLIKLNLVCACGVCEELIACLFSLFSSSILRAHC